LTLTIQLPTNFRAQSAGGPALADDTANKPKPRHKKRSLIVILLKPQKIAQTSLIRT
jgi:hypothetical protein